MYVLKGAKPSNVVNMFEAFGCSYIVYSYKKEKVYVINAQLTFKTEVRFATLASQVRQNFDC